MKNVEFLNWYIGILVTAVGVLFTFLSFFIKNEFEEYKEKNKKKDFSLNRTQDEIISLRSSLDVTREKLLNEIIFIKEKIKDIPVLNENIKSLQLEFTKISEQIKYLQKDFDQNKQQSTNFGKVIIKDDKK